MFLRLLEDLRFVIGFFFTIISIILFFVGLTDTPSQNLDINLNLIASAYMGTFSLFMLAISIRSELKTKPVAEPVASEINMSQAKLSAFLSNEVN